MVADEAEDLPDLALVLGGVLARTPAELHPLVVALAERMAARRYEHWAAEPKLAAHRDRLLECARREKQIASQVEGLFDDAESRLDEIRTAVPDFEDINRTLFAGLSLDRQILLQARAERIGAATWSAFSRSADGPKAEVLGSCAPLEVASAEVLEEILSSGW